MSEANIAVEVKTYISIQVQGQQLVFEPDVARDLYNKLGNTLAVYEVMETVHIDNNLP